MEKTSVNNGVLEEKKQGESVFKYVLIAILILIFSFGITFFGMKYFFSTTKANGETIVELGPLYESPEITVNLANTNGRHFLKTQFSLEVENKKVIKELEEKLPIFNDKVITVLSTQTIDDLNNPQGIDKIKEKLVENINSFLINGKVKNIYFNNYIWQ